MVAAYTGIELDELVSGKYKMVSLVQSSVFCLGGHRRFYPATGYNSHEQESLGIKSRMALFWLRAFGDTTPLALYLLHKYLIVNVQVRYALTYRRWRKGKYRV